MGNKFYIGDWVSIGPNNKVGKIKSYIPIGNNDILYKIDLSYGPSYNALPHEIKLIPSKLSYKNR